MAHHLLAGRGACKAGPGGMGAGVSRTDISRDAWCDVTNAGALGLLLIVIDDRNQSGLLTVLRPVS